MSREGFQSLPLPPQHSLIGLGRVSAFPAPLREALLGNSGRHRAAQDPPGTGQAIGQFCEDGPLTAREEGGVDHHRASGAEHGLSGSGQEQSIQLRGDGGGIGVALTHWFQGRAPAAEQATAFDIRAQMHPAVTLAER